MRQLVRRFRACEAGAAVTEYALIIAVLALGLIAVLKGFSNSVGNVTNRTAVTISHQTGRGYGSGGGGQSRAGVAPAPEPPMDPDSSGGDDTGEATASRRAPAGPR